MDEQVLHLLESVQVELELGVAPAGVLADLAAREAVGLLLDLPAPALGRDHLVDEQKQPSRLRRQLVQGPAEGLRGQPVGQGDVLQRGLDVLLALAVDDV